MDKLNHVSKNNTGEHWLRRLNELDVPAGPIMEVCEMQKDPQALARKTVTKADKAHQLNQHLYGALFSKVVTYAFDKKEMGHEQYSRCDPGGRQQTRP